MDRLKLKNFILLLQFLQLCAQSFGIQQGEESINPLTHVNEEEVNSDKVREERWDWGFKKQQAEPYLQQPSSSHKTGSSSGSYGIKTSYKNSQRSGYGRPSGGYSSYSKSSSNGYNSKQNQPKYGGSYSISQTSSLLNNERQQILIYGGCAHFTLPFNVEYKCLGDQCEVKCPAAYTFPNGKSSFKLTCVGGSWILSDSFFEQGVPQCQATCLPPCQNNGICAEAGVCKCPPNYYGPYCEKKKSICASDPPVPANSNLKCLNGVCHAECMRGFKFTDSSTITNLHCQDGRWIHTKSGLEKPPDCLPTCEPPCENGGKCISFNVCQCSKMHRGNRCQYSVSACNLTSSDFNGKYKCSFDNDEASCIFSCPAGKNIKWEGNLNIPYKCKYSEGQFMPQPLPKCIYPPGYRIASSSITTHFTQTHGSVIGGGGIRHGVQYTEHERIMSILEKFRTLDIKSEWWSSGQMYVTPNSYSLYMSSEVDVMLDRTPKPAMCTTWGGNNMKTFDGLMFTAPLSCSHTLITDIVDATFDVTLIACPFGSGYGCAHAIKIYWQSVPYTIENLNGTIRLSTPKKKLPIPVQIMGMKVRPVAEHIQIDLESIGLKIDWDHHQHVSVHAGLGLWSKVGGLCGSLDGDYKNDLMSKHGKVLETVKAFTDSWRVEDNSELCSMDDSAELEFGSGSCDPMKRNRAIDVCERLLANQKLEDCVKLFNFEALLRSCVDNYCNCPNRDRPEACSCDDVSILAKECSFKGIKLEHGWRNLEICPITCSFGRIYLPCGPDVEPTCDLAVVPTKNKCNEGCFCPEGTVQYKEACITSELCPCTMGGKEFKPESLIKKHCNTCTCKNGQWKCTDEKCGARCGAIGDPHYQTFDGKRYDFMGKCSYVLLKARNVTVEAENVACSGTISENMNVAVSSDNPSCTKSVTIRFALKKGAPTTIKLGQGLSTHVNNKELLKFPKILGAGEVLIRQASSTFMTVEFPGGIRVWWDGVSRVYIDAPPSLRDETSGLCGTFNSNTQDDFLTPEGDIETAVEPFADKWRTKDTCDHLVETTTAGPHPCSVNRAKKEEAEKYCNWILEDIFQDCHWTVEPEKYYEDCLYDVCACKNDLAKCFCPILAAYGTECMRQGVKTGWRMAVKECAVKCPAGQVYDECGDSCALTCEDLAGKSTCQRECVDGCRCPHGEYLNDQNECVPQNKCPCMFDGVAFLPGYKEVRPGKKFEDLCTCENGIWECEDAEPGDKEKYPPSSELRAKCTKQPFAEFVKCAPKEPKTCKNMHEYVEDLEDCKPDCVCMPEYVYDMSLKTCVLPESCSCHHGGKSYGDGEKMKEDCNICVCKSGNWECSSHGCESTCSVWGDSHFTTFDNLDYDFQGECDYILSKGVAANGDGFTITIQNVLCGTMGVTCSKSLEIALCGSTEDSLKLSTDAGYLSDPEKTTIRRIREAANVKGSGAFHIYKAGVFVVIEVIALKLQVKWDEGTRAYIKLGNEWKNKVAGLCGNYNDNSRDDMQTPSQSIETSPLIFGHSWKTQNFCAVPKQPIDACKEHPERITWAQLKCGVLKSQLFKECHSEVPIEKYLKRCIFDTCACDQGGDCECLCTSIAAYAHACSQKGINIRWRTPHLCPMQCDPHCSEYKSCTPACAVETCENFLDQGISERICNKENCIEGCHIKPCDEGMIYLNDSYRECVPKSDCKPVCMIKDGQTFYEGDITYRDACSTCSCSKKKEVCSGVKCTEETTTTSPPIDGVTLPPLNTEAQPKCVRGWTRWFDDDDDTSNKLIRLNDEEKLPRYDRMEQIYGTCQKKYMKKIECRVVKTHEKTEYMDEQVTCSLQTGLACIGQCHDYEIRVFCQCDESEQTTPPPTEKPSLGQACDAVVMQYKEYPGDCHKFLQCTPLDVVGEWTYVEKTCGENMMFNPTMNICDHIATVQVLKPSCGDVQKETKLELVDCPPGMIMSDCANQCEHTCHYYGAILHKRGLCKNGEHCKPGCVSVDRPNCPQMGKYWRDENKCVESDECPCMDKMEKYVQPHMPVVGEWETCQCIENAFVCMPNKFEPVTVRPIVTDTEVPLNIVDTVFPTTVTPPLYCSPALLTPLIQGNQPLPDSVFNASSSLGPAYMPHLGRLYTDAKQQSGSWSPSINDQMQYLQVSFEMEEPLFGVIMAGSPEFDNYVTLFKILYSHDGEAYHYLVDETDKPQLFNGPLDSRKPIKTLFKIPVEAKSVRIYPLKWHGSIAMRVELLGCGDYETTVRTTIYEENITTKKPAERHYTTDCTEEMGVTNGQMIPQQVTSSEMWKLPHPAKKPELLDLLKLSSPMGWRPLVNSPKEFVEFDFMEPRNISGFITKGGPEGWVTSYKVAFSRNKKIWNKILNMNGQPRAFPANHDSDTETLTQFKKPLLTQYVRLLPETWERNINMRIEPVGCYAPYPIVKEKIVVVEKPLPKCHACDGVFDTTVSSTKECKCKDGLYWDGDKCVQSNLCPCVENYITYPIGSKFENKNCEDCVCILGGQSSCKPKKCPKCENKELRPVMASGCYCKCEPCPKHQKLCPSSGDCIPEILWCNGIQDCADDEDESCVHTVTVSPTKFKNKTETVTITCPKPECPPNMKLKIMEKKSRQMSEMFSSSVSKKFTITHDGDKVTRTKVITAVEEFLPLPNEEVDFVQEEDCAEFLCVPDPTIKVKVNETFSCIEPKCPENYKVELDMSTVKPSDCKKYTCVLRPKKDDVCEISGKSFTTFDGTEFKYDTCSHILARDLVNASWIISVHLHCKDDSRKVCRKMITIKDVESAAILTIMPNMKLNFNSFEYTVQQLINSPICKAAFVISQLGNTVLVVSRKHGYWVAYDDIGYIKVGISSKYIKTVDGLCGYYNRNPLDDKRAPDGTVMPVTMKFGDSWFDKKIPKEQCYPQTCPFDLQKKALVLCNNVKHPTFLKCGKSVNYKQFSVKCIETTCECLRMNNGDASACKCAILQDFVKKCLTVNPNVQLDTWRAVHQCEISCPTPLVHSDCYKRRCEPSCDTLHDDECPIIPDACFSGCYCPEGTVRKDETCVPVAECKDCVCNSFGTSKYFTYDRNSFTFNGNCTYLLSRDIILPGVHTFQVYVTMDDCKKLGHQSAAAHTSCAKSLHVLNGDHVIHIQRTPQNPNALQILVDGFEVKRMPYKDSWIHLREVNGKEIVLGLPNSHVELTAAFDDLVFSLAVPSIKYGSKMEGLCGDCNGDPTNDLVANPNKKTEKKPSNELMDVIKSWQADEPKLGLKADECLSESTVKEDCIPLPPEKDPCMLFFNEDLFGKCSMVIDPLMYVSSCQQDMCKPGGDQKGACDALSAYAKECAKQGICLNWRRPDICPYNCPSDMIYEPCGCAKTCEKIKAMSEFEAINLNTNSIVNTVSVGDMCTKEERFEGCFCPPNKVMDNRKCVNQEQCIKCEDSEHALGEKWQKDKCTECTCNKEGKTECTEKKCMVEENICAVGHRPKKTIKEDECCPRFACVPEVKAEIKTCLEPLMPICGPGQFKKQKLDANGCPQYICECKPKEECEPLVSPRPLLPGEKIVKEDTGCCPTQKIVCDKLTCPKPPEVCSERFYEIVTKQTPDECCPTHICSPPKDKCIVKYGPNPNDAMLKDVGEKWSPTDEPCKHELCAYGPNDSTQIITTVESCETKCPPGYSYVNKVPNLKCCGECTQTECVFESKLYKPEAKWKSLDNCTTYYCAPKGDILMVSSTKETCPDVSSCPAHLLVEDGGCCKYCKQEPVVLDKSNCLPVSLAETETVKLIKYEKTGHGMCVNKEPIKGFTECIGACDSGSKYNPATLMHNNVCHCCNIRSYKQISIPLVCEDGTKINKELEIPESCGCSPCAEYATYQTAENQYDIRLRPLPLAEMIQNMRN